MSSSLRAFTLWYKIGLPKLEDESEQNERGWREKEKGERREDERETERREMRERGGGEGRKSERRERRDREI